MNETGQKMEDGGQTTEDGRGIKIEKRVGWKEGKQVKYRNNAGR